MRLITVFAQDCWPSIVRNYEFFVEVMMRIFFWIVLLFYDSVFAKETSILSIHSYDEAYPWTREQRNGFRETLDAIPDFYPAYSAEYLDTKRRVFDKDYENEVVHYMCSKYKGYCPDIIYVTDDNALKFMIDNREKLFPNVPVVFSGINDKKTIDTLPKDSYSGVHEEKKIIPTLQLIKRLFPSEREILLIGDGSSTAEFIKTDMQLHAYMIQGLRVRYLNEPSIESTLKELKAYKGKNIILTTIGGFHFSNGNLVPLKEAIHNIVHAGDFHVFSAEDTFIQEGVIGGYANDGTIQGNEAAKIALQIFNHPQLPLAKRVKDSNGWIFDIEALKQHHIKLPADIEAKSVFINPPVTFYQKNEKLITDFIYGLIVIVVSVSSIFIWYLYRSRKIIVKREGELVNISISLNKAQELAHFGNWVWDMKANTLWWSNEIYRIFGLIPQEFAATYGAFLERVHPDDREAVEAAVNYAMTNNTAYSIVHRIVKVDGTIRYVREEGSIDYVDGQPVKMNGIVQDISEQHLAQAEIEKLSKVVEQIDDEVVITDMQGVITYVNQAFCDHTGYTQEEVLGENPRILKSGEHDQSFYKALWKIILHGDVFRGTMINRKKNGDLYYENKTITPLKDDVGNITGFVSTGKDVTLETQMHKEMEQIATIDKLTGIYNRHKFEELYLLESERSRRFSQPLSLILIDIDRFKSVNDTYGHNIGDDVLKKLAIIVQNNIRQIDIFARWGGEEFLVLSPSTDLENIQVLAEKLRLAVAEVEFPMVKHITISQGISVFGEKDTFSDLFKRADKGLYYAKEHGRNQVGVVTS